MALHCNVHCNHTWTTDYRRPVRKLPSLHSKIFRYGRSIFCLPHQPKISDFFDLCLHWVSVVRATARALYVASKMVRDLQAFRKIFVLKYLIVDFLNKIYKLRSLCFFSLRYWKACFPLLLYPSVCCRPFFLPRSVYSYMYTRTKLLLLSTIYTLWHSRLWSFQGRDTKLERFLAKNQLYSNEIPKF